MAKQIQKKFIGNDQVDSTKILLEQSQSIRAKDSTGTEQDLIKLGASDEVLVKGQEVSLKADLQSEVAAINGALSQINSDIAAQASANATAHQNLENAIDLETSERQAADALKADLAGATFTGTVFVPSLYASGPANIGYDGGEFEGVSSKVFQNSTSTNMAINSLGSKVIISAGNDWARNGGGVGQDVVLNPTSGEIDATNSVIKNVFSGTASHHAVNKGQLDSVESGLQAQISALSGSSGSSLAALEAALTQEIADRIADVDAEEVRAMGVEASLQEQIDNVLSNVDPGALDSLTEIVTAFQAADASLNGAITALSTGLSADIAAETSARQAADTALQGEIDAEEIARAAADTTLQNNINSEASTRAAADTALSGRVSVLESVVWFKEKFSITNGQTSVTLSHVPEAGSVSAFVDRLAIHEGSAEDYTIGGVGGKTMTFLNDLVSPGQSQIGNGDTVYIKYQYKV